jgi:hypothetical protein
MFGWLFKSKRKKDEPVPILGLILVAMVMLGFISLTFPPGARQLFDFLTVHLPGWVAVVDFYETFAIPYVVAFALATAVGFYVLATFLSRTAIVAIGVIVIILFGIYGAPLLIGDSYRNPYYSSSPANRVLSKLPSGYTTLASRIVTSGGAPVLSLPLLQPAWTYLVGTGSKGRSNTYIGIPPLYYLYGVSDYTGVSSFESSIAPDLLTDLENSITTGNAESFSRVVRLLGVRWVESELSVVHQIDFQKVNSQTTPAAALSFAKAVERDLHAVAVANDGKFSLLRVPAKFASSVISIDRATVFSQSSNGISRVAAGFYQGPLRSDCPNVTGGNRVSSAPEASAHITRYIAAGRCFVTFRVPYSSLISATLVENGRSISLRHREVYGFANGFILPALKRGHVTITFSNKSSFNDELGVAFSLLACLIICVCPFVCARRRRDNGPGSLDDHVGVLS